MADTSRPFLLDVTRLVSRSWTKRRSTGIDRVCYAYCRQFRDRARAVIQHRGVVRVLSADQSDTLFDMLLSPDKKFRSKVIRFAPTALARAPSTFEGVGSVYINVSHTDFDLDIHHRWVETCGLRSVYLLHDLIPITHPHLTRMRAVQRHRGRVTKALEHADGIILNSQSTATELHRFARENRLPPPPISVSPLGVPKLDPKRGSAPDHATDRKPYFVCVGTLEARKNYSMLLAVWERLAARLGTACPRLVMIGQEGPDSSQILEIIESSAALSSRVKVLTRCPDKVMARYLQGARALLMPTLAEGVGLPVLEALDLGTPVIASDIPSIREMGQGIPLLLDPTDEKAWEDAIIRFDAPPSDRKRQLEMMPGFETPSWDDHFASVDPWLSALFDVSVTENEGINASCLSA